jgi:hypothetical protein
MSTYADSSKAALWLDGDAFRAPAATAVPTDIFAASLVGWEAFGGIQAGFNVARPRNIERLTIWNKDGTYRTRKDDEEPLIGLRPVDLSKAAALTLLRGGSLVSSNGGYEWVEGTEEFFALIVRVVDGTRKKAYYVEKGEMPVFPEDVLNDEALYGWDMEITPLVPASGGKPVRHWTDSNPLA